MRKPTKLLDLLVWLKDGPKVVTEMYERHDGRTVASASRRELIMEYMTPTGKMVMTTARGTAFLILEGECES